MPTPVAYFSSVSANTAKFVAKLAETDAAVVSRIPYQPHEPIPTMDQPYVLIFPTYGMTKTCGRIPPQVHAFLAEASNRENLAGVVGCGNTNFGADYAIAADLVVAKVGAQQDRTIPILARVELMGTATDVATVSASLPQAVNYYHQQQAQPRR